MRHGAQLFIRNEFKLTDPGTWLSSIIRFALNLDNRNLGNALLKINHTANVIEVNGAFFVIEAGWNKSKSRGEVISTPLADWEVNRTDGSYVVKYPTFHFNADLFRDKALESVGITYGYFDVIFAQPWRLLLRKKVWFGSMNIKTFYCSKLSAWLWFESSGMCSDYYTRDPEELFDDQLFK